MPRVKKKTKQVKKRVIKKESQNFFKKIKVSESYVSLALGALVVFIIFILGILFLNASKSTKVSKGVTQGTSSAHTQLSVPTVLNDENKPTAQKTYVVKTGDDLWSISEKAYNSGYNWVDIAKANNIESPGLIFAGQKLIIPNVKPIVIEDQKTDSKVSYEGMSQAQGAILGNTYTIVKGDDLWNIAVRAYGDGYKYVDIIKANNLENPSLIFSGNILKIPR